MERTGRRGRPLLWLAAPAAVVGAVVLLAYLGLGYRPIATTDAFALGPATLDLVPIEPAPGSGNKHTWLMNRAAAGSAVLGFELRNTAPFPVTVEAEGGDEDVPRWGRDLVVQNGRAWETVDRIRIPAGDSRQVGLRFVVDERDVCARGDWGGTSSSDWTHVRVRYLGVYRRTDRVELPFVWAMTCERELPPPYDGGW